MFPELLDAYHTQISDAIQKGSHHDHRRALLINFLREAFDIEVDEIELEKKVKAAEVRGRIDAFYKYVIFEIKVDLDRERADAMRELKKYFESRREPEDYVAAVTDGLNFEVYDYEVSSEQPKEIRKFSVSPTEPNQVYSHLDELLSAGQKVPPTSDDIVLRFGLHSLTFVRTLRQLGQIFNSVAEDSAVAVKYREWNALLAKVYGSAVGDQELFLRHTYLTVLSRAIVTMVLFPRTTRTYALYRELLTGEFFREKSILNLAEPDFFSWALDTVAEKPFLQLIDALFKRLAEFDWNKLDEDLLKMLYQELVDPADRSGLGEFYTPDWLAEMVLDDIGYTSGSLLDPACGSGTFLFCAVRYLRGHGLEGRKLVEHVMESIVGLDVHPVAVLMAKANLLLALAPELRSKRDFDISLRVYMADTLLTGEKKGKNYLAVPDGMGHNFAIPLKSIELNRNLDQIIDQLVAFAQRGAASDSVFDQAQKGFFAKIKDLTLEEINLWKVNFALMVELVKSRRDTVWGFILKNAFRPAYLRRSKVDFIVGNPPWLSFRDIAEPAYKVRIKDLIFGYGLLEKSERQLFTQMDTSTLFFVHCLHEFLKPGGTIAFVMPKTTILPSKQHAGFQRHGVSRIHDMSKVTVVGLKNQHFFNVKSCVVISSAEVKTRMIPMTSWHGVLTRKNLPLGRCRHLLTTERSSHDFLTVAAEQSPYYRRAFQGATLNPHTLWFAQPDTPVTNVKKPTLKTSLQAYKLCKEDKWKVKLKGPVEDKFLFGTALSDDLLPFFVRRLTLTVLPVLIRGGGFVIMTSDEILGEGFDAASDWVRRAEGIYAKRSKEKGAAAQGRLNYQHLLTDQLSRPPYIVLYNKSGTNICAACLRSADCKKIGVLDVQGFVAESVTYRIYTDTEQEALYLVGVLNSGVVNKAIKPYQTEGVYHGKRDIHRRPFEVCAIPEFDASNPLHIQVADLAAEAETIVEEWGPSMEGGLAKVREVTRGLVSRQMVQIDSLVRQLLSASSQEVTTDPKKSKAQAVMF